MGFSQDSKLFEEANALYNQDKFGEAIEKYEQLVQNDEHSAEVYYNLGNAHYKLSNVASSIYYYERALMLSPNDEDIKNNLAFAQNMTIDAIEELPQTGISKFFNDLRENLTTEGWGIASIVFVSLFVLLFLGYYFAFNSSIKRITFIASILSIFFALVSMFFAFQGRASATKDNPAIVFAEKSSVRSGPKLSDEEVFVIHEGTKVQVLDEFDNWQKVQLADGKTGWLPSSDVRLLKVF